MQDQGSGHNLYLILYTYEALSNIHIYALKMGQLSEHFSGAAICARNKSVLRGYACSGTHRCGRTHRKREQQICGEGSGTQGAQRPALRVPARHMYYPCKKHTEVDKDGNWIWRVNGRYLIP